VNPLPTINAMASPTAICFGATTTLSATGANAYNWNNGATAATTTVLPASTTIYSVTGTDINGCQNTQTVTIMVNALPTVNATASSSAICVGGITTLSATGTNAYTWSNGAIAATTTVSPTITTTYSVTGTDNNACSNTATVSIVVNPLPTINAMASPSVICIGETTTLSATGVTSYTWTNGTNTATAIITPTNSVTYSVTGTDANSCVNTATVSIVVNKLPIINAIASPSTICVGKTSTLVAVGSVNSYTWSNGVTTATTSVPPTTSTTYSVTGTDANNCVNTTTVRVVVNNLPIINTTASPSAICVGATTTLSATGANAYNWINGPSNATFTVAPTTKTTYTVTGTDNNNCSNTTTVNVKVNPLPTINATANPSVICAGDTTTLMASGASSYKWNNGLTTPTFTATPTINTTYSVTGTGIYGCIGTQTIGITVNPLPTISANANPTAVCIGGNSMLIASGATSYTWTNGPAGAIYIATPGTNTTYTVSGINALGCLSKQTVKVTVNPLPIISVSSSTTTACPKTPITFTATGAASYSWSPGGQNSNIITEQPASSGANSYSVSGQDLNGCRNSKTITVNIIPPPKLQINAPAATCVDSLFMLGVSGALSYTWTPGGNHQQITALYNTSGIYTYQVAGANQYGCVSDTTFKIAIYKTPLLSLLGDTIICSNTPHELIASGASTYTWSTGSNDTRITISPTIPSSYTVVAGMAPCTASASIAVQLYSLVPITAQATPQSIILGQTTQLQANSSLSNFVWDGPGNLSCQACQDPKAQPTTTSVYTVSVTDDHGCVNRDTVLVLVDERCGEIFIPTAFSPNNDSNNDVWQVHGNCIKSLDIQIFDRWGQIVFQSKDPQDGWDGRINGQDLNSGVFIYQVFVVLVNGEKVQKHGNLTLIR